MNRFPQQAYRLLAPLAQRLVFGLCLLALSGCKRSPEAAPNGSTGRVPTKSAPAAATNAAPVLAQGPQSVFSTNIADGLDPFFPHSSRRVPKLAQAPKGERIRPAQPHSTYLKLTGLWPNKTRPLALINRTPLGPGEEANITVTVTSAQSKPESHKLLVRCLEVRNNSVLISIDGEPGTKELVLPTKL